MTEHRPDAVPTHVDDEPFRVIRVHRDQLEAALDDLPSAPEETADLGHCLRMHFDSSETGSDVDLGHAMFALGIVAACQMAMYERTIVPLAVLNQHLRNGEDWIRDGSIVVIRMPEREAEWVRVRMIAVRQLEGGSDELRWEFGIGTTGLNDARMLDR